MTPNERPLVLLVDSNVLFVRRITSALKNQGFEVTHHAEASYALTMLEWNKPDLILCAIEFREMGAFAMVSLLSADPGTAKIPVMALGNGSGQGQMQAYRAGCHDYIDRRGNPTEIASHIRTFLESSQNGFQPTQLLSATETSFAGSLAHLDLPGIAQMLEQMGKTGALHINAGEADAIIFFEAGKMTHAEYGTLTGDAAAIQIVKDCHKSPTGNYKFVADATAELSTVSRSTTNLLLDAMREVDETQRHTAEEEVR